MPSTDPGVHQHTHDWQTRSSHHTLAGLLRYQYCTCGVWRIVTAAETAHEVARAPSTPIRRP